MYLKRLRVKTMNRQKKITRALEQFSAENASLVQETRDVIFSRGEQLQKRLRIKANYLVGKA